MKSILLFYLLSTMFALVSGAGYVWDVFFPVAIQKSNKFSTTHIAFIASSITDINNLITLSASELWNIKDQNVSIVADSETASESSFNIELQKDGWVLEDKRDPEVIWFFRGVIQRPEGMTAVFYNKEEKWILVQQQNMFKDLQLVQVNPKEIILLDTAADKEWRLGLFDLKYDIIPEKEK